MSAPQSIDFACRNAGAERNRSRDGVKVGESIVLGNPRDQ
jgi:hypothetical protein